MEAGSASGTLLNSRRSPAELKRTPPKPDPTSGVRDGFHTASHHSNARARMDTFAQINRYHVQMLGYFLEKLKATPDGDGNLLDHSVVLYGSSMSNGNQHDHDPLPILVAGGASGQLKGDRHRSFPRTRRCRT